MKVLGVCIGAGVMVYPFRKYLVAGIEPRKDYYVHGDWQWQLNFDADKPYLRSLSHAHIIGKTVDVIIGHPTCGHSSMLALSRGKKLGNPKEDTTLSMFIESVSLFKPQFFLFENLPTLLKTYPDFLSNFTENYRLVVHRASMAHFGNSQVSRVRLIVVGIRKDVVGVPKGHFNLPEINYSKLKKVHELESGLWEPNEALMHIRESDSTVVCMEKDFRKLSLAEIKKEWNSKKYKKRKKWDATTTGKGKMKNLPGVYRNLANDYPLTARKQNRQFNSRGEIMTPRELARIQGVPDKFRFFIGSELKSTQYYINKARLNATKCPPMELSVWFKRKLKQLNLF